MIYVYDFNRKSFHLLTLIYIITLTGHLYIATCLNAFTMKPLSSAQYPEQY